MRARRPPRSTAERRSSGRAERGQTTIDFAVGATLFLLTMAFVFTFVPVMFQPFATSQSDPLVADRVANRLATDVLGDPAEPYVLDETCTTAFFASNPAPSGCSYLYSASSHPYVALGVEDDTRINVTLVDTDGAVVEKIGDSRENARDVITAQRRVLYGGESHELYVRVW
ncbi:DUF7287 family protein [Salinigranum salinum]|uniref:DUF7287 family protein n=1 Tax=Salinigranum salinum TaxID=1364937 RepID=UPI00126071BF|nr:hypothetical protein [Salinigranum salinum]